MVGIDDRGGERYHITGTAPAAQVSDITVGLVKGQDVAVDFWIHPDTYLVTAAEFTTTIDGGTSDWALELDHYGDTFTIEPPANVRETPGSVGGQQQWLISPPLPTDTGAGRRRRRSSPSSASACSSPPTTSRSCRRCCARSSATSGWCCPTVSTTRPGSSTPT